MDLCCATVSGEGKGGRREGRGGNQRRREGKGMRGRMMGGDGREGESVHVCEGKGGWRQGGK